MWTVRNNVYVLAAASPKESTLGANDTTDAYLSSVSFDSVAAINRQCYSHISQAEEPYRALQSNAVKTKTGSIHTRGPRKKLTRPNLVQSIPKVPEKSSHQSSRRTQNPDPSATNVAN